MKPLRRWTLVAGVLLAAACGTDLPDDAGEPIDTPDAGSSTEADAGAPPDAGEPPDAGDVEEGPDAGPSDTQPPTLVTTTPANGATGLPHALDLVLVFSEPIARDSVVVTSSREVTQTAPAFGGNDTVAQVSLAGLGLSTLYTLTLEASDLAGNALEPPVTLTFTTIGDVVRPTVLSTDPAHNAAGVSATPTVRVVFSEPMDAAATEAALSVNPARAGTASWSGNELTWTASSAYPPGVSVSFTVGTGARDLAGNPLQAAKVVSFRIAGTADTTRPAAVNFQPGNAATGVSPTLAPSVTFNEPMDRATVEGATTFTANGAAVAHTKSWNEAGTQLTLTPAAPLPSGANVVVAIGIGAKDPSGNALMVAVNMSFKVMRELELVAYSVASIDGSVRTPGTPAVYLTERNLFAGDQANDTEWWRSFLSFDLSGLEAGATAANIVTAQLEVTQTATYGNISASGIGPVRLVSVNVGPTLEAADLTIAPLTHADATVQITDAACNACRKTVDVLEKVKADVAARSQRGSRCQFRLETARQQLSNGQTDGTYFYSGESQNGDSRPVLRVRYRVP